MSWNFQPNPTSFWSTVHVTRSNFFDDIFLLNFLNDFTIFSKNWLFHFDTRKFRFVAFLGMKILCFCYRIQKFRIFHRIDERHGWIQERAVHTFFPFFLEKWAKCWLGAFDAATVEHAQTFTTDRARQALSPRVIDNFGPEQKASFFSITQFLTKFRESPWDKHPNRCDWNFFYFKIEYPVRKSIKS